MPSRRQTIWVRAGATRYPVYVGYGLLGQCGRLFHPLLAARRVVVISTRPVWQRWGEPLRRGLRSAGFIPNLLLMKDGEEHKSLATVEQLAGHLVRCGADRSTMLVALGGGVVGDVTGFVAATFMRGLDYVQIPTTLVGQIDSAIGGKTGVNLPEGKNLLGAFHHPCAVLVDPETLATLPAREFQVGLYELVKYAVIGDPALFHFLEQHLSALQARQRRALAFVLLRALHQKARVVAADERERDLRRILNFGHTFGHALEALAGYRGLRHGEAVGWGMLMAARLAQVLGLLAPREGERIARLIRAVGRLPRLPHVGPRDVLVQLVADKKRQRGSLVFVLPERVGRVRIVTGVPTAQLLKVLAEFLSGASAR